MNEIRKGMNWITNVKKILNLIILSAFDDAIPLLTLFHNRVKFPFLRKKFLPIFGFVGLYNFKTISDVKLRGTCCSINEI